jgi:hypothetical protein
MNPGMATAIPPTSPTDADPADRRQPRRPTPTPPTNADTDAAPTLRPNSGAVRLI